MHQFLLAFLFSATPFALNTGHLLHPLILLIPPTSPHQPLHSHYSSISTFPNLVFFLQVQISISFILTRSRIIFASTRFKTRRLSSTLLNCRNPKSILVNIGQSSVCFQLLENETGTPPALINSSRNRYDRVCVRHESVQFWVGRERLEERGGGLASLDGGRGFHVEPFFLGSTVGLLLQDSRISLQHHCCPPL
jgi:hypothetical protein